MVTEETRSAEGIPTKPVVTEHKQGLYYGYWLVAAAFVAQFVAVGGQNYVIGVFLKPMTQELGWSRSEFIFSRTIGQAVMAFAGFFIGAYVDRRGGRRLMFIGGTVLAVSLAALGSVQTLWQWWLLNGIVLTMGAALIGNLVVNVTLSKWFVEKRGRVVGFSSMGVSFAGVTLPWLTTVLVDAAGWRTAWRVIGLGALVLIYPVAAMMRRAPEDYGLHPDGKTDAQVAAGQGKVAAADFATSLTRREAIRTPAFYLIVLAFGLVTLNIQVMLVQTVPFLTDAGHSRGWASLMITVISIPAFFTKPLWGWLIDKADPKRLASIGGVLTSLSLLIVVLSVQSGSEPVIIFGFFLLGWGWGGLIPLQEVIWASYFGRRYLGSVRSAALPLSILISASAPLGSAMYFDRVGNYNGAFLAMSAAALLSAVLLQVVRKPKRAAS